MKTKRDIEISGYGPAFTIPKGTGADLAKNQPDHDKPGARKYWCKGWRGMPHSVRLRVHGEGVMLQEVFGDLLAWEPTPEQVLSWRNAGRCDA